MKSKGQVINFTNKLASLDGRVPSLNMLVEGANTPRTLLIRLHVPIILVDPRICPLPDRVARNDDEMFQVTPRCWPLDGRKRQSMHARQVKGCRREEPVPQVSQEREGADAEQ